MNSKFNILTGDWTDKSFYDLVFPSVANFAPKVTHRVLPITQIDNDSYWNSLRAASYIDIACLDYRSWYLDDPSFLRYVNQISSVNFKNICVFDSTFFSQKPQHLSWYEFIPKLLERSKIISHTIRKKQPKTNLIAPAFGSLEGDARDFCSEFLTSARNLFDTWSMFCISAITEQSLGTLTSMANECLSVLKKPIWVTKFAIPSCEHPVKNHGGTAAFNTHYQSANQMRTLVRTIESLTNGDSKWFYSGSCCDFYHPDKDIPDMFWKPYSFHQSTEELNWSSCYFLGCIDYQKVIKRPIVDTVVELAKKLNAI